MDIVSSFTERVRGRNLSVVLPEGRDERIIRAARRLKDEEIAQPIVLGRPEQIEAAVEKAGVGLDGVTTINPKESDKLNLYADRYSSRREGIGPAVAKRIVVKPLFYGGMMVSCGDADTAIGGVASATAILIQAGVLTVGLAPGIKTPSSYFLMVIPDFLGEKDRAFIYADCAINIDPTAEQLRHIIDTARRAGIKVIFVQTQFSREVAGSVAQEIDGVVVSIDPLAEDYIENLRDVGKTVHEYLV